MNYSQPKWGIVLAGGGAKGAYQAGVLKYIAEIGLYPEIIAGTSIGALNGAILASYSDFSEGVNQLNDYWDKLGQANILRPNTGTMAKMASYVAEKTIPNFTQWVVEFLNIAGIIPDTNCVFDPRPIESFLRETVNPSVIREGIELWVTTFPSLKIPGIDYDLLLVAVDLIRAQLGTKAHWLRVKDFQDDETLYTLLLASAAIPLAFPQRTVNGQSYVDGALGDNIPLGALIKSGITHTIVIHLENASVWNRQDFPEQTIIEIRPVKLIDNLNIPIIGDISSLLDFSPERISLLKQRGYEDAQYYLEPIQKSLLIINKQRQAQQNLICKTDELLKDKSLDDI